MKTLRICPFLVFAACLQAQSSPQDLADAILQQWNAGSPAAFAAVYPFPPGRQSHAGAVKEKAERARGLAHVVHSDSAHAVLLLSGVWLTGNSGDDTAYGMEFSGIYTALAEDGRWRLERQIPFNEVGQIVAQKLQVTVRPGSGVEVEDVLRVRVKSADGFVARLNHQAKLQSVRSGGVDVAHRFGGGLLWADLPQGDAELTMRYSLEVEQAPKDPNSGCFTTAFGHIRNQYFWHPFFGFSGEGDDAEFQVEVRIPKDYGLTTSLPQGDRVEGQDRIVRARSSRPASTLSLAYDRDWKVVRQKAGDVQLELFVTPEFRPDPAATVEEFREVYAMLASRFGESPKGYVAIVQERADRGNYWHFNSNQALFAAGSPGHFSVKDGDPGANLAHEIAHFWTKGSGPAANFLMEGWATYVEGLVVEREFGADTMKLFWKQHARKYFDHYDGKVAMWGSDNYSDLNYDKGSWVFRMLEDAVGPAAFRKAMTEFSRRSLDAAAGWETLAECFQHQNVAGFDAQQFLLPWLKEKGVPRLTATADGSSVTIEQAGPLFVLPVTIEGITAAGKERHRVWLRDRKTEVPFSGAVSEVRIDPDELLLLRR